MDNADMPANSTTLEISNRYEEGHYDRVALGLTKREHFAGLAMQGYCVHADINERSDEQISRWSVLMADALLKELER